MQNYGINFEKDLVSPTIVQPSENEILMFEENIRVTFNIRLKQFAQTSSKLNLKGAHALPLSGRVFLITDTSGINIYNCCTIKESYSLLFKTNASVKDCGMCSLNEYLVVCDADGQVYCFKSLETSRAFQYQQVCSKLF